jgi:hypothetical protein
MEAPTDLTYYTEPRFAGPPEEVISGFAAAARALFVRLAEDLRAEPKTRFTPPAHPTQEALADGLARAMGHVDELERVAGTDSLAAEDARVAANVVANVFTDANFMAIAEAHATSPRAPEGKFDVLLGSKITGSVNDMADKLWQIADLISELVPGASAVIALIAILLRDLGIFGPELSGPSVVQIGEQLENKLEDVIPKVDGLTQSSQRIEHTVTDTDERTRQIQQELERVEGKADNLGDLLGRTLVGEGWIVDPLRTRDRPNKVPARDVKQELHDLERILIHIDDKLDQPPPDNGNGNGNGKNGHDHPRGTDHRPVVLDTRLKKIFVWAEGLFAPTGARDQRRIRVKTPAFDLSGWLDLSRLRTGDVVEAQIRVSLAGRRDVLFARTRLDRPELVHFAELARGGEWIPGSNVLIVLRQPKSADDFATPIELAYQFVVESQ